MIDREQLYEAFDNGLIGLDDIIDISQQDGYNQALKDLLDRIDLMFLYKDTKGISHSASYANLNRKNIEAIAEQLKK